MTLQTNVPVSATVIFYTLGVCIMLPWNFFITADSYWQYKLRNVTLGDFWDDPDAQLTRLQVAFTPSLVIVSNIVVFLFGFVTSAIVSRVAERVRIIGSMSLCLAAMSVVLTLSFVNTDQWQKAFFGITITMVALMNVGVSVLQASCYGMAGQFPSLCMTSLVSGQALAGVVSSLSQIISLAIGEENPVTSAHIYFAIAIMFIVFTALSYLYLRRTNLYKSVQTSVKNSQKSKSETTIKEYINILKKIKWMGFSLGLLLMTTLSVYPAVQVYVTSVHSGLSTWADVYFQPTITFLLFNVMDMAGRESIRLIQWPSWNGWLLHALAAGRLLFIPLILLCNGENKTFPTLFHHDIYYIIINAIFAYSGGYFGALTLVYYSKLVAREEAEIGGTLMAALMGVGMVAGSCLSPGFVALWGPKD